MPARPVRLALYLVFAASILTAAPRLRLSSATIGPVDIPAGSNGPTQSIETVNAGDGTLNLQVTSSADWLTATLGDPRACTLGDNCRSLRASLSTASLDKGIYTGILTLTDPNAVDAPQTVTVTVQVGGGIPDSAEFWLPPGGSASTTFSTNTDVLPSIPTSWISVLLEGSGSFRFVLPWRISINPPADMAPGDYTTNLFFSSYYFPAHNKSTAITLHVATDPIAALQPLSLNLTLAHDVPYLERTLHFYNAGQGTLTLSNFATTGGDWLAIQPTEEPNSALLHLNTSGLALGSYTASITIEGNHVNPLTIPVNLTIVDPTPPVLELLSTDPLAQSDIAVVRGRNFSFNSTPDTPLDPAVQVLVNGQPATILKTAYDELTIQLPADAAPGLATLQVLRDDQSSNLVSATLAERAPRLLSLGDARYLGVPDSDYARARNNSQDNASPVPATPAHPGDQIEFFAYGLGNTPPHLQAYFGGSLFGQFIADPIEISPVPDQPGLFHLVVQIPYDAPTGNHVLVHFEGEGLATNPVALAIQ